MRWRLLTTAALVLVVSGACQAIIGLEDGVPLDGGVDASTGDSSSSTEAASSDGGSVAYVYNDIKDPSFWSSFDLESVRPGAGGYGGGAFDGRYLFLAPDDDGNSGMLARFDTQGSFSSRAAWDVFDISRLNTYGAGYIGATSAKGRVYFAPYYRYLSGYHGTVAVLDPSKELDAGGAWAFFNTRTLLEAPYAFHGGGFDGRFVYFAPYLNGSVARYDTEKTLDAGTSWSSFDVSEVAPEALGFSGTVFDGRYLYLVPNGAGDSLPHGVAVRFDTQASFISNPSWKTFDITTVNANAKGFYGGAFDGRYVYYVPSINLLTNAIVVRYDTHGPFDAPASWLPFSLADVSASAKGFLGAAFDGRYLYLVPNALGSSSLVTRHDTTGNFSDSSSWSTFDLVPLDAGAKGFRGAIFDGQFVYFIPRGGTAVARFDARTRGPLPVGQSGSFL